MGLVRNNITENAVVVDKYFPFQSQGVKYDSVKLFYLQNIAD